MIRRLASISFLLAVASLAGAVALRRLGPYGPTIADMPFSIVTAKVSLAVAVLLVVVGTYRLTTRTLTRRAFDKQRAHTTRNVLGLVFATIGVIGVLAAITDQ